MAPKTDPPAGDPPAGDPPADPTEQAKGLLREVIGEVLDEKLAGLNLGKEKDPPQRTQPPAKNTLLKTLFGDHGPGLFG